MNDLRDKIMCAAFNLYLKYGIKSVSMDDIARTLGISKKTIYTVVEKKKDLVFQVLKTYLEEDEAVINKITQDAKDSIEEMLLIAKHVLAFLRAMSPSLLYDLKKYHPGSWNLVEQKHHEFIFNVIRTNLKRGIDEGLYLEDLNPEIVAKLYVHLTHSVADETFFPLEEHNRSELYKEFIKYHMRGIVTTKGRKYLNKLTLT